MLVCFVALLNINFDSEQAPIQRKGQRNQFVEKVQTPGVQEYVFSGERLEEVSLVYPKPVKEVNVRYLDKNSGKKLFISTD